MQNFKDINAKQINSQKLTLGQKLKQWARKLKNEVIVIYFVMKHKETPPYVKVLAAVIVGYALSPIDLIPDFVPVFGYLDDAILLPLCIALLIKIIPAEIMEQCRIEAENNPPAVKPEMWAAAYVIIIIWLIVLYELYRLFI
jgi:uncharacterized membrane protein YkvA (DUF1232 family)